MKKSTLRGVFIVAALAAAAACGLDVVGSKSSDDGDVDGGDSATARLDGRPGDATSDILATDATDAELDAGLDVNPANCAARCDGGKCDGGWCVLDCPTSGSCQGSPVVCPTGIPCDVHCRGDNSCNRGVDCTRASACAINCTGTPSCQGGPVACSGPS